MWKGFRAEELPLKARGILLHEGAALQDRLLLQAEVTKSRQTLCFRSVTLAEPIVKT